MLVYVLPGITCLENLIWLPVADETPAGARPPPPGRERGLRLRRTAGVRPPSGVRHVRHVRLPPAIAAGARDDVPLRIGQETAAGLGFSPRFFSGAVSVTHFSMVQKIVWRHSFVHSNLRLKFHLFYEERPPLCSTSEVAEGASSQLLASRGSLCHVVRCRL